MGASAQKKKRQELKSAGIDPFAKQPTEQEKQAAKFKKNAIIVTVVVAVVALVVILLTSNLLYNGVTAVRVGNMNFTSADYGYYRGVVYNNYYNTYYQSYGSLAQYLMPDEETLKTSTLSYMQETAMLYDQAVKAGHTLSAEEQQDIENTIAEMTANAETNSLSLDGYLTAVYGKGMNSKIYRKNLTMAITAVSYASAQRSGYTVTEADQAAYYEANKDDLDQFTFRYLFISGAEVPANEETGTEAISAEDAMAAAKSIAEQLQEGVTSESQFMQISQEVTGSEATRFVSSGANIAGSTSPNCAEWLRDAARQSGEIGVIEEDGGYFVLYFVSRHDNNYETVNVRHILIRVSDDVDDETAKAKAEEILQEWQNGEATEASFGALADEYSDDTAPGGLYENVYKNQMVDAFDAWIFTANRKAGDVEIVKSDEYGYHILYYVGRGYNYKEHLTDEGVRNERYTAWSEDLISQYPISSNWVLNYTR